MRRCFWQYVHDRLEDAWHWVYYHKLAGDLPKVSDDPYQFRVYYVNGRGQVIDPSPVFLGTENEQEG